jgi:hypothetical protein
MGRNQHIEWEEEKHSSSLSPSLLIILNTKQSSDENRTIWKTLNGLVKIRTSAIAYPLTVEIRDSHFSKTQCMA